MSYYGHHRNSGIVRLNNYAQALQAFEDTKPIKGRTPELRPLGHRRNTWFEIAKGDKKEIICKQYGQPIVTFYKNGNVEIKDYLYRTTATASFIWEVLGLTTFIHDGSLVMCIGNQQYRVPDPREGAMIIKRGDDMCGLLGNYHFVKGASHKNTHVINRANKKEIMAKYKPQIDYIRSMAKLREGEPMVNNDHRNIWGDNYNKLNDPQRSREYKAYLSNFMGLLRDKRPDHKLASWAKALELLHQDFGTWSYHTKGRTLTHIQAVHGLEYVLMGVYRDKVFDVRDTGTGEVKRDRYSEYFSNGWNFYHGK